MHKNVKINTLKFTQNPNCKVAQQGQDEQDTTEDVGAAPVHQEKHTHSVPQHKSDLFMVNG